MKKLVILSGMLIITSCSSQNHNLVKTDKKLEIAKVDSVDIYYILNFKNEGNTIVIGEIQYLSKCAPFKKYIFKDSIKTTPYLKEGKSKVFIGANEFYINDKKIKNSGEPVKYIDNCESFSD